LLAVDLGLWTGLAVFSRDGRCLRYRSTHFPSISALKQALPRLLDEAPGLAALFCEGDRQLGAVWTKLAEKRGVACVVTQAERWREVLLAPHERRDGAQAKAQADVRAREVLAWSGLKRPTSLRHDAAEAILLGVWGGLELGWIERAPWLRAPRSTQAATTARAAGTDPTSAAETQEQ
jgi:hypothetical protein